MSSEKIIPNLQRDRLLDYIREGKRFDGRMLSEYRELEVEKNISKNAESSVRVRLGKTEVIAGVKLGVTTPYPDSPNQGTFMTTAELHPMASSFYDTGKPGINSIEIARVIDRGIRESGLIDFDALCITEGEKVWQVFLDIIAINDDGNMLDVAGIASIIALGSAKMPEYNIEEDKIDYNKHEKDLPLNKNALSFNMTFHKIGDSIILDVNMEEESVSLYRLSIAMGDNKGEARITAMQKGKEGAISSEDMETILNLAEDKFKEMFPLIKGYVFE